MMNNQTKVKFENLKKVIAICGDWWRFEKLYEVAKEQNLSIPCRTTIEKYCNIQKRIYDWSYGRYTRYDGKDLSKIYEDEFEFRRMSTEEKINTYLIGTLDESYWEDEYGNEFDYWWDNGTYETMTYHLENGA